MYRNITERWAWGGLDKVTDPSQIYLDETVRRMVTTHRSAMIDLATEYVRQAYEAEEMLQRDSAGTYLTDLSRKELPAVRTSSAEKAREILDLMREKLPTAAMPYSPQIGQSVGELYMHIGEITGNDDDIDTAIRIIADEIERYAKNVVYYQSLSPSQYQSLQNNDKYIDQIYLYSLLSSYVQAGGSAQEMIKHLEELGVDTQRMAAFQQRSAK